MPNTIDNKNLFLDTQFQQFVQFAEGAVAAGKEKAVARLSESELGGIVTRTIKPTSADWVGVGAGRLSSLKKANNTTREAFMKAVSDMFGGPVLKVRRERPRLHERLSNFAHKSGLHGIEFAHKSG